jgi:tRNA-dihydrouridine synthase A
VYRIKALFPKLEIIINGGINSLDMAADMLSHVDGVMLGREAYQNPFILHEVDQRFYDQAPQGQSRADYLRAYLPYVEAELTRGTPLNHMTRHLLGLFKGQPGGKQFRRHLSENSTRVGAGLDVLTDALACVTKESERAV